MATKTEVEVARIPSPQEIEQYRTPNGGWTRHDLQMWGVQWPPRHGWKAELEKAYHAGFTVGVILECIACREARFFVDPDPHPVCEDCQSWEEQRYETRQAEQFIYEQAERQANRKQTFKERVVAAFKPAKRAEYKKEPIPAEIRWAVWERDNFTCLRCGSRKHLAVDHIFPEANGGKMTIDNAQTLCKSCNSSKGTKHIDYRTVAK
jgi:5-methylcytosine-specific restriction endonuclease McrA